MKKLIALALVLVLATGFGAYAANLRIAVQDSPATTNPFRARSVWSWKALGPCLETLLSRDMNHKIVPWLAKSYEFQPQKGQLKVYLKEDVEWHDGTEFKAEDVVFTYKLIRYFDFPLLSYRLDPTKSVEKGGPFTVIFNLDMEFLEGQESPILYEDLLMQFIVQKDQWKPVFEKAKKAKNEMQAFWKWMPEGKNKLQGTGPFKFSKWRKGSYVYLKSFENWHMRGKKVNGKKLGPYIDGIVLKIYRSTDSSVLALKSGKVDLIGWPLQKGYVENLSGRKGIAIKRNKANGFYYFAPNLRKQPWSNKAFRKAVDAVIDREFIAKRILQGQGKPLYSVVPPGNNYWYNPNIKPKAPKHSVKKAKQILRDAGFTWRNGQLVMPNGDKVKHQVITSPPSNYDPLRYYSATLLQRWIGQLGVSASVKPISFAQIIDKVFDKQEFDAFILGWSLGWSVDYLRVFYSNRFSKPGGYNAMSYDNPKFDKIAHRSMLETNRTKRRDLVYKMQKILREDLPIYPLYVRTNVEAHSTKFVNWHEDVGGISNLFSFSLIKERG